MTEHRAFTGTKDFGVPVKTGATALRRAGIDWQVEAVNLKELTGMDGGERFVAAVRESDRRMIGCNGTRHTIIQNTAMAELADTIIQMNDGFTIKGGGAFPSGDKAYLVLTSDRVITFGQDDDKGFQNVLLVNDFNGNSPLTATGFVGRFACTNQIAGITRRGRNRKGHRLVSVSHTKSSTWRLQAAKDTLRALVHEMDEFEAEIRRLLDTPLEVSAASDLAAGPRPEPRHGDDGQVTNQRSINDWERRREVFRSELYAPWNEHLAGTALGAVMAAQGIDEHLSKSTDREVSRVNRVMDANFPTMDRVLAGLS